MKHLIAFALSACALLPLHAQDEATANGVVSIDDNRALTVRSNNGSFEFKPYLMVQTHGAFNWYDDEGLDKAYNQDNVANSGFAMPYAVLGFTGKAYDKVTYNLSINAAASGANVLQQAWFDVKVNNGFGLRAGKFKTPFAHAYLTTLGETLLPMLPTSLTAPVILPYSLNAVTPSMATGFDLGVEAHGLFAVGKESKLGYQLGVFNGSGSGTNAATKTFSDDWHIPSLLYAGRLTYQPWGVMPATQGSPKLLNARKILVGLSGSLNVESENESTNDSRFGFEFAMLYHRWYFAAEGYAMHMGFTKRMKLNDKFNFYGGYAQVGYFATPQLQLAARYDFFDRNGSNLDGTLNSPALGFNYFFPGTGLKLSAMYQYTGRWKHKTQLDRDNDDLGIATHSARLQLQYSF